MKPLKDWSEAISGLGEMDGDAVLALYSEMLATAHDLGYKVPDDQLIETEDVEELRRVIPPLHDGLVTFHAAAKAEAKTEKPPKKPVKKTAQKVAKQEKSDMTTATATVVKKTAKKAAPAKKAAAKPAKKAAKKAAKANARTGVGRNPFPETAVIRVLNKENPARADSERGKRIAAVFKLNGKKVSDFYKLPAPLNRTDTLRFLIDRKFISVK